MTRDEAVKSIADANRRKVEYCGIVSYEADAAVFVDNLIALGMLKLDEPKSADECWRLKPRVVEALKGAWVGASVRQQLLEGDVHFIIGWLENAGLKIVEK